MSLSFTSVMMSPAQTGAAHIEAQKRSDQRLTNVFASRSRPFLAGLLGTGP